MSFDFRRVQLPLLGLAAALCSFAVLHKTPTERVADYYLAHLRQLHTTLTHLEATAYQVDTLALQAQFATCRAEYKHLEFALEYYYPHTAQRLNGAALPETEPGEPGEVISPTGFQVLEAYVYGAPNTRANRELLHQETDNLLAQVRHLEESPSPTFTPAEVFDAVRLNLYRLAAKGITGFDSPVAHAALPEAATTLRASQQVLVLLGVPAASTAALARGAAAAGAPGQTFEGFDRAAFLGRYFSPALAALRQAQVQLHVPQVAGRRAVRPETGSYFGADAFETAFFAPTDAAAPTPAVLALGAALFREPLLSGRGGRSCISCHLPGQAYTDGLRVNSSLLPGNEALARNTPTLLNSALQPDLFYDSRVHYLEDQVHAVVSNKAEMGGQLSEAPVLLRRQGHYDTLFKQAFAPDKQPLTARNIRRAVAAYVRSLVRLDSRFDRYLRGDTTLLSQQETLGFNLFMGKAQCGTCHYLPLFNGAVPPLYDKTESEVLGVPATTALPPVLDPDPGKYLLYGVAHQRHAFKTPTVRNAALTAPYMHNGVYQTLEQVLDFYNQGGGAGLGLDVPNQTLAPDNLHLSQAEQQAIIAFIKSLNDAPPAASVN